MDKTKYFEHIFGSYLSLRDEHLVYLDSVFNQKSFIAREILVKPGQTEKFFFLVITGVQVLYHVNKKGEKVTLGFSFSNTVSGVYDSFVDQKPSQLYLEVLIDSTMLAINRTDFEQLFILFPEFYSWRSRFIENILFGRLQRELEFLTHSAKDRFIAFTKRCPPELLKIPQKYLASYLNMAPETFSRMRSERFT